MHGMSREHVVHVLPPTSLDFSNVANSQTLTLPVAQRVPADGASEIVLIVRMHAGTTIATAGQSVVVALQLDGFTPSDPATQFQTALNTAASVTFSATVTAPAIKYVASSIAQGSAGGSFGEYVAVTVAATQPAAAATLKAVISIDLVFKGGHGGAGQQLGQFLGYV